MDKVTFFEYVFYHIDTDLLNSFNYHQVVDDINNSYEADIPKDKYWELVELTFLKINEKLSKNGYTK